MDFDELTKGFQERYSRIALFGPFEQLKRKSLTDLKGNPLDFAGMGLLCLLYFFEQKLIRNQKAGVREFAAFLRNKAAHVHPLPPEKWEDVSRSIIEIFRPPSGKRYTAEFFDWETFTSKSITFSFFKANTFDMNTNTQYYTLDDDGLELVFATKEFYGEFQLSINQLLLRKQLEKGEFKGALRQINEMRMDVETLEERIIRLTHELKRNITSEETFRRYSGLIEDILLRLGLEHEEFQELQHFVKETKDRLYYKDLTKQEEEAYTLILQISTRLEEVHHQHANLLHSCTELKSSALRSAQEALYFVGIDSFNFDQDITSRLISTPLPLESMKGLLAPFLSLEQVQVWTPLMLFAAQPMRGEREERDQSEFIEADTEEDEEYIHLLRQHYTLLFNLFLTFLDGSDQATLEQFTDHLHTTEFNSLLDSRAFYDFFLLLHQRSPILRGDEERTEDSHILDGVRRFLAGRKLTVIELPNIISPVKRFAIQNLQFHLEEVDEIVI
ncbi:hypothetical protein HNO89_000161 [Sporosarcina luteola]|nr:hypothetical protein [Sporosarcina luteola]